MKIPQSSHQIDMKTHENIPKHTKTFQWNSYETSKNLPFSAAIDSFFGGKADLELHFAQQVAPALQDSAEVIEDQDLRSATLSQRRDAKIRGIRRW